MKVRKFEDFGRQVIKDADGERIPAQDLYFLHLANGFSYGVRGSGTEPKIKFYLFCQSDLINGDLSAARAAGDRALKEVQQTLGDWAQQQLK